MRVTLISEVDLNPGKYGPLVRITAWITSRDEAGVSVQLLHPWGWTDVWTREGAHMSHVDNADAEARRQRQLLIEGERDAPI